MVHIKSFSIVGDFHREGAGEFLNGNLDVAGMRMPGHIRERFLSQAIEGRALGAVQLVTLVGSEGGQMNADASPLGEILQKGMQGRNQAQVVQQARAQIGSARSGWHTDE